MDLYFGSRRLGEVRVTVDGNIVRFEAPGAAAALLSEARNTGELARLMTANLASNADKVCGRLNDGQCGLVETDSVAVIVDEGRLRIHLFVGEALLSPRDQALRGFLPVSSSGPSLVTSTGLAISGSGGGSPLYNLQNRLILASGAGRIESNVSFASNFGIVLEDLVAEVDHRSARYSAGLFWAPTNDFVGNRRIIGLSFRNQLETSLDRDRLQGTSEILFLRQPARVELLVNGRLVDSRYYDAGNIAIDTLALPGGASSYTLRIQEGSLPIREEQRFFVRSTEMAPQGRPLFHVSAGFLAESGIDRLPQLSNQPFVSAGASIRIAKSLGIQANLSGTTKEQLAQASLFFFAPRVRVRASGLVTTSGATSAFLQMTSNFGGAFYLNADVRANGGKRASLASPAEKAPTFDGRSAALFRFSNFFEGTASAGLRMRTLDLQLNGSVRKADGRRSYAIVPSVRWHLADAANLQVTFLANAGLTEQGPSGFAGLRIVARRGALSTTATAGTSFAEQRSRAMISSYAEYDLRPSENTQLTLNGGVQSEQGVRSINAGAVLSSSMGRARADLVHGSGLPVNYALNAQLNGAVGKGSIVIGGRDVAESVLVARVRGGRGTYEVLLDGLVRGTVRGGQSLSIFLPPYRAYQVQLRALGDSAEEFDPAPREITVYPGNIIRQDWDVSRFVTIFGRFRDAAGRPIVGARVEGGKLAVLTEDRGAFQLDVPLGADIVIIKEDGSRCSIPVPSDTERNYLALGDVTCA